MMRRHNFSLISLATIWLFIACVISAEKDNKAVELKGEKELLQSFDHSQLPIFFSEELNSDSEMDEAIDSDDDYETLSKKTSNNKSNTNNKSIGTDDNNKIPIDFDHSLYSDELASDEFDEILNIDFENQHQQQDHNWDVLIFTQQWPVTTCYHWREEDKTHACSLPSKKEFWTIHGIWPTKLGHFGPSFCNKTADFNINQLEKIMDNLKQYWPDIDGESNYDWLWKHEWLKHGTCAALLEELDDELKYFGKGLTWREDHSIARILDSSDIHPDSNNTVVALQTALLKGLGGKNPSIHCLYDSKNDVSYLAEIRICFNKTLDLTDCDGVKLGDAVQIDYPGGTVITNCHISKPVHYPSLVPPVQRRKNAEKWKFPVVNMYKLLQFIMWFTL